MISKRLVGLAASVLAATAVTVLLAPPPIAVAAPAGAAVSDFGACLAAQRSGDLLLMIDESSSLQTSDPSGARIGSAIYLLDQLEKYRESSGVQLDVAVAGFADSYAVDTAWTSLDAGTLPAVVASVEGFRDRTNGVDTDYWLALDGARQTLAQQNGQVDGVDPCQAVAWFSDGKIDFTPRTEVRKPYAEDLPLETTDDVQRVVAAATESICRPGGVADQLRSSGVVVFGIGLAAGGTNPSDFDTMRSIATGEPSGAATCGNISQPSPGDFYLAQNIDDLLFAFDAFSTPGQAPLSREAGVCAFAVCEEGKHRFVLDDSIDSVDVLASADVPGLVPTLVTPEGTELPLPASNTVVSPTVDGIGVSYQWQSDRTLSFELNNSDSAAWQGSWALVFVDPTGDAAGARSKSNIHISGNLFPQWIGQRTTAIHSGESDVPVDLAIVDAARNEVDPETLLGAASLSVVLIQSNGEQSVVGADIPKERIGDPLSLDLSDVPAGNATVRLTLDVTTADAETPSGETEPGTRLAPQSVDVPLTVAPPIGFPSVGGSVDFGTLEGAGTAVIDVPVTGPGCVWLADTAEPVVLASPDGVGDVSVATSGATSIGECTPLADGVEGAIPIELTVQNASNGAVNGTVQLMVAPAGEEDRAVPVDVTFTAELRRPLDTSNALLALVVALILGPGVPLLLLYAGKWLTAKIPARTLKAQQFPVTVAGSSVLRDGTPFRLSDRDLIEVVRGLDKPARAIDAGGVRLQTHVGWSPVGAGFVTASSPGRVGASSVSPATHGKSQEARLPLAVHNTWFVLHDPSGPADNAVVVLLIGDDSGASVRKSVVDDMTARLPSTLAALRSSGKVADGRTGPPEANLREPDAFGAGEGAPRRASPYGADPSRGAQYESDPFGGDPFGAAPRRVNPNPSGSPQNPPPQSARDPFDPFGDGR